MVDLSPKKWTPKIITKLVNKKKRCLVERRIRRKFEKEFKIEAVKLVTERGMKVTEVSRDLGISKELLYRWKNDYERAVIVSNDTDVLEALRIAKYERGREIGITMLPRGNPTQSFIRISDFIVKISNNTLASSQLPDKIPNTNLYKPGTW